MLLIAIIALSVLLVIYLVRDDAFLSGIVREEEQAYFFKNDLLPEQLATQARAILDKCPVSGCIEILGFIS